MRGLLAVSEFPSDGLMASRNRRSLATTFSDNLPSSLPEWSHRRSAPFQHIGVPEPDDGKASEHMNWSRIRSALNRHAGCRRLRRPGAAPAGKVGEVGPTGLPNELEASELSAFNSFQSNASAILSPWYERADVRAARGCGLLSKLPPHRLAALAASPPLRGARNRCRSWSPHPRYCRRCRTSRCRSAPW